MPAAALPLALLHHLPTGSFVSLPPDAFLSLLSVPGSDQSWPCVLVNHLHFRDLHASLHTRHRQRWFRRTTFTLHLGQDPSDVFTSPNGTCSCRNSGWRCMGQVSQTSWTHAAPCACSSTAHSPLPLRNIPSSAKHTYMKGTLVEHSTWQLQCHSTCHDTYVCFPASGVPRLRCMHGPISAQHRLLPNLQATF